MKSQFVKQIVLTSLMFVFAVPASAHDSPLHSQTKPTNTPATQIASGVVFHDLNGNRKRDQDEAGLSGVKVSNGLQIVKTDEAGNYSIPISDDCILFVIKPRGWMSPLNELNLPQFYYIHKPKGSPNSKFAGVAPTGPLPASIDFPLTQQNEPDQFRAILFGDTQPRNVQEVEYMAHDIIEQIVNENKHGASLGVTLGDVVFDDLSVFKPHNQAVAMIGLPWYNVIGNHDMNLDAPNDKLSDETFESHFGPNYYSFDYGCVHFLALDDVTWIGQTEETKGHYVGGFGAEQMEFIRNDLAMIPNDQLVVLMMHIPLVNVEDRQELYRLIEKRPFALSLSAHTHFVKHHFIDQKDGWAGPEPHHHVVNVTVCGSWWRGATDELGIPHATMSDGGPNGYSLLSFDGTNYSLEYRAARRDRTHQMSLYLPQEITVGQSISTAMIANVFFGSIRSKVEMRQLPDGQWQEMEQVDGIDPYFLDMKMLEVSSAPPNGTPLPAPSITDHLWRKLLPANLGPGTHMFEVRSTDMHGNVFTDRESIRVLPIPQPAKLPVAPGGR